MKRASNPRTVSAANFSFARGTSIGPAVSVPEVVPDWRVNLGKYWSEWQDLNLRPPRPERGSGPEEFATILLPNYSVRGRMSLYGANSRDGKNPDFSHGK